MMEVKQYQLPGLKESGVISVSDKVFGLDYNKGLIWQLVNTYLACGRSGNKANLSRGEVRGGGAKPWRQKGLGKARAGSNCSPIWRTGGVTFAAKPRDHSKLMPKKMYRAAIKSLLSDLVRRDVLLAVDEIKVDNHKTKTALSLLGDLAEKPLLLLVDDLDKNLDLSLRNLPKVKVLNVRQLNPVMLAGAYKILATKAAMKFCEEWLL